MNKPSQAELRAMAAALAYPANQRYDPVTLEPMGVTRKRVELMQRNMPQLLTGGKSLLDVGSSKGFFSFTLRDRFDEIDGYEMSIDAHRIAEAVRQHHGLTHIRFINKPFRRIEVAKHYKRYDVVYAGSVHHHFFKDALLHGAPPFLPLKKLTALADKYLILDGPLKFAGDYSLNKWAKEYGWGDDARRLYTLENHVAALKPQFELIHGPLPNERGRETVVFERVQPDIPCREMSQGDIDRVRECGTVLAANKARDKASVIRLESSGIRYKFDRGLQGDGVFMILNSLPEWFAHTREVLVRDGNRIGDVAEWVEGRRLQNCHDLRDHWLRMNNALACIGLIEIHVKLGDYVWRDGWVDVDVDLVSHVDNIAGAQTYLSEWRHAGARLAFGETADYIADNLLDEWVFAEALKRVRKGQE